jgi:hypothetical protein
MRMDSLDILGTKEMVRGVYELLEKPTFVVVNMVLPEQVEAHNSVLKRTFGEQTLAFLPCLCEVRGLIAKGKTILIDEELEYSDALLDLSHNIEAFAKNKI